MYEARGKKKLTRTIVCCLVHFISVLSVDGIAFSLRPSSMVIGSSTTTSLIVQCSTNVTLYTDTMLQLKLSRRKFTEPDFYGIASITPKHWPEFEYTFPPDIQNRSPNISGSIDTSRKYATMTLSINTQGLGCTDQAEFRCAVIMMSRDQNTWSSSLTGNFTVTGSEYCVKGHDDAWDPTNSSFFNLGSKQPMGVIIISNICLHWENGLLPGWHCMNHKWSYIQYGEDPPECVSCNEPFTDKHFMTECLVMRLTRDKYYKIHDMKKLVDTIPISTASSDVIIDRSEYYDLNGNTLPLRNNSVLNTGTIIKYRCTANVSIDPEGEITWEMSRDISSLNNFDPYFGTQSTDIDVKTYLLDACFYRKTSTMYYNMTRLDLFGITFRCRVKLNLPRSRDKPPVSQPFTSVTVFSGLTAGPTTQPGLSNNSSTVVSIVLGLMVGVLVVVIVIISICLHRHRQLAELEFQEQSRAHTYVGLTETRQTSGQYAVLNVIPADGTVRLEESSYVDMANNVL